MTDELGLPIEIIPCPTMREIDGLAMSSRNVRLTANERKIAPVIYRILNGIKDRARQMPLAETEEWALRQLNNYNELKVEYIQVVDAKTLLRIQNWNDSKSIVACVAVHLGKVRLIDNLILF